jgi:hypothetical protein
VALVLWASSLDLSPATLNVGIAGLGLLTILSFRYVIELLLFHHGHKFDSDTKGRLPPRYPSFVPFVGAMFQLAVDHKSLTDQVS